MKKKPEMTVEVADLKSVLALLETSNTQARHNNELLNQALTKIDVIVNLLLDMLSEEQFQRPRKLTHKIARLDATGIQLRPIEVGKMVGRPSKDVVSRRKEYKLQESKKNINPPE